jgi:hypothetical protein
MKRKEKYGHILWHICQFLLTQHSTRWRCFLKMIALVDFSTKSMVPLGSFCVFFLTQNALVLSNYSQIFSLSTNLTPSICIQSINFTYFHNKFPKVANTQETQRIQPSLEHLPLTKMTIGSLIVLTVSQSKGIPLHTSSSLQAWFHISPAPIIFLTNPHTPKFHHPQ